jgi:hypothetical protein
MDAQASRAYDQCACAFVQPGSENIAPAALRKCSARVAPAAMELR